MPRLSEDWLAVLLGGGMLAICLGAMLATGDATNPLKPYLASPGGWADSPADAFTGKTLGLAGAGSALLFAFALGSADRLRGSVPAFLGVFGLATLSIVLAKQETVAYYGLAYALWAIVLGLAIANTAGTPAWLRPAVRTELYMKVGLVLLGGEVLLGRLLALGLPGICIAWIVTPIVLCTTFWFGQRILKIESPSLNMVISADMSVCGVSAAIATAAACRAKKEELSLAIGLSMAFTVGMMLAMPPLVRALDLPPAVGGAWIGGTIDSTGAVGAAGELLGGSGDDTALVTATTIKMIQNILIGVVAFGVATYWVTRIENKASREASAPGVEPRTHVTRGADAPRLADGDSRLASGLSEVWQRFPKFILGFLGASIVFSLVSELHPQGEQVVGATISGATKTLRGWCFALAFVSIGLDTNFRRLAGTLRGGKPLLLYVTGQSLNLVLTLAMAWLMFGVLFPQTALPTAAANDERPAMQRLTEAGIDPGALFYSDHPRTWGEPAPPLPAR